MPWAIELSGGRVQFPEVCPFCTARAADSRIERKHTQSKGFVVLPGIAVESSREMRIAYPACGPCVSRIRGLRWWAIGAFILPFVIFSTLSASFDAVSRNGPTYLLLSLAAAISACVGVLIYREWLLRAFRIAYLGDSTIFAARSREYAEEFAGANGARATWKTIIFRVR